MMTMFRAMESSRFAAPLATLLDHGIDYAGLFPPAGLSLDQVVRNYAGYRAGPDRWALGHLIVPAARLAEFPAVVTVAGVDPTGWGLSATFGADPAEAARVVAEANHGLASAGAAVVAVEARVADPADVAALARSVAPSVAWYGEVDLAARYDPVLDAIAAGGGFAKIRMGGTTADLFPDPDPVVAFLLAVTARALPFKATAGLHHPFRGSYRLTDRADGQSGFMYGYLNLMLATMLAQRGAKATDIRDALLESDPHSVAIQAGELRWRHHRLSEFDRCRTGFHGFGSCSFREPIDELGLGLTP